MEHDNTPAKRLKYSPESLFAPKPERQFGAHAVPFNLQDSNSKAAAAADVLTGAPAVLRHNLQLPVGSGHRLTATAAPFVPRSTGKQAPANKPSLGWHSGFGPSLFNPGLHAPSPDTQAEDIVRHVFEVDGKQVRRAICHLSVLQVLLRICQHLLDTNAGDP